MSAATVDGWDHVTLRREQLADNVGQTLQDMEDGQHSKWKDITYHNPICESYWIQWNSLVVRDSMLECNCGSTNEKITAITVLPSSKVKKVLAELHGGFSGGQLGVNKTLNRIRKHYYWLYSVRHTQRWCQKHDTFRASYISQTRSQCVDSPVQCQHNIQ
jgi:hypothetical protein